MHNGDDELLQDLMPGLLIQRSNAEVEGLRADEDSNSVASSAHINMDIDIDLGAENMTHPPDEEEEETSASLTNDVVFLEGLLQRTTTNCENWTHIVHWPQMHRHRIMEPEDASQLYQSFAIPQVQRSFSIVERRLCDVTRLSLAVHWSGCHPDYPVERVVVHVVHHMQCHLRHRLQEPVNGSSEWIAAIVLMQHDINGLFVVHFPLVSVFRVFLPLASNKKKTTGKAEAKTKQGTSMRPFVNK